jgi:aspartate/methionine/tyrosine aminotransferase
MTDLAGGIEPFRTMAISRLADRMKAEGRSIIRMQFGQPSTPAPRAALAAAHEIIASDPMGYWESAPLKERIARLYAENHGVAVNPGRVILTCGASPALVLAFLSLFKPGDRVAIARPGYVAYRNTLKSLSMVPVEIPCGPETRYQLTAAQIAALDPAPAGLVVASPANPTGTMIAASELAEIARVCELRGIRIVSDEIYHRLSYIGPAHSMLEFSADALIINSFSKYYSMAPWRLGWLLASDDTAEISNAMMGNLFLTPPSLSQHMALIAMDETAELDGHLESYARNRARLLDALPKLGLGAIAPPDGAFYIYADVGHLTNNSFALCEQLLRETGIALATGSDFDPLDGHRFLRMSFAVSETEIHDAIERLTKWLAEK